MLATLGDLIEDVVVRLGGPLRLASDTPAVISHRRGGSAANVAARAATLGYPVRFLGQVGHDRVGDGLVAEMETLGVDMSCVVRGGSTGTIVVVVDQAGERSMLTDRRSCVQLAPADPAWLDDVTTLHVPLYTFAVAPLSATGRDMVAAAHDRGVSVSIDLSSVAAIAELGADETLRLLRGLQPSVVFANADEARAMAITGPLVGSVTVVKRGADPATVHRPGRESVEVPAIQIDEVVDTTGAGDAFAAGFLCHGAAPDSWGIDPAAACRSGHQAAVDLMDSRV